MTSDPGLKIKWQWESAGAMRTPEHAATWAGIEIWAGSDCVTLVENAESGSSRRMIYCPLYALAEWVAFNWWTLQADARPARELGVRWTIGVTGQTILPDRLRRHSLRAIGDGFLWPNLLVVPEGDQTRLIWRRDSPAAPDRVIRFLTQGDVLVDRASVTREFSGLISEVLTRLAERGVSGTPLHKEWQAIQETDRDETAYCLAAARLGLDPYSEAEPYERSILGAAERLSGRLLDDFFDAVEPDSIDQDLAWIDSARQLIGREDHADQMTAVQSLRSEVGANYRDEYEAPWERGWRQARRICGVLGANETEPFDLTFFVSGVHQQVGDRGLLAAGGAGERVAPIVVIGQHRAESTRRFTLARALWHQVWDDEPVFLVTTAYTDRQKVERAFAAELLAPASGIAHLLGFDPSEASPEDVDQVAESLNVSPMVVQHQLQNQLLPSQ